MSPQTKSLPHGARLEHRRFLLLAVGITALCFASWLAAQGENPTDLTVHEWGTFTAVAGKDGRAVEWQPLTPSTDLPEFVEHVSTANFKLGLRGTIRMETPVMYFYSPQEATVSVKVAFVKGLITEWYPHASRVTPSGVLRNASLDQLRADGSVAWNEVHVSPNLAGEFSREDGESRYYAARETASAPLRVTAPRGEQEEKFLFYRGVSAAPLPLTARLDSDGRLWLKNLGQEEIPAVVLFERRGEAVGYRSAGALADELVLDPPELNARLDSLCAELESILVDRGLYPDEARAMLATWRDSWFEEGSRLMYIVPSGFVDSILPLTISPAPTQIVRVFVGRLEIVTAATAKAVAAAVASNDESTLDKYRRFLEPILQTVRESEPTDKKSDMTRPSLLSPSSFPGERPITEMPSPASKADPSNDRREVRSQQEDTEARVLRPSVSPW